MSNKTFEFSPRTGLVMANLKTVINIRKVLEEEGEMEFKKFSKYIRDTVNRRVPDIQSWKCVLDSDRNHKYINFYYDDNWKVLKNDYICICIELPYGSVLLEEDFPWVGLYVPEEWEQNNKFREKLEESLPKHFMNDWEKPDEEAHIWAYVYYEDYAKGDIFDINGFMDNIVDLVNKLVVVKDTINNSLLKIQKASK